MHPIIFKIGPLSVYSYGMMVAIGFLFGIYIAKIEAIRKNIKADLVYDFAFYLVIGSLVGSRLYYIIFFSPSSVRDDPLFLFKVWEGGLAIHGAIFGGIITGLLFSKLRKISFWVLADIISPAVMLGQAIGRIGCFLNGCCFGAPTKSFLGVRFPEGSLPHLAYGSMAIHPSQLYEAVLDIVGFIIIWSARKRIRFEGGLFLLYLISYSIIRLIVSVFRGDSPYLWNTNINMSQLVSIILIFISMFLFIKRKNA